MGTGDCDCGVSITGGEPYGSGGYGVGFGTTAQGDYVIGTLDDAAVASLNVTEFVTGFSWLVRDGVNVAPASDFVAPRTTIGTAPDGRLLSLEVDGCEPTTKCEFVIGMVGKGLVHRVRDCLPA